MHTHTYSYTYTNASTMCPKKRFFIFLRIMLFYFHYYFIKFLLLKYYTVFQNLLFSQVHCSKRCGSIACYFLKFIFEIDPLFSGNPIYIHMHTEIQIKICTIYKMLRKIFSDFKFNISVTVINIKWSKCEWYVCRLTHKFCTE